MKLLVVCVALVLLASEADLQAQRRANPLIEKDITHEIPEDAKTVTWTNDESENEANSSPELLEELQELTSDVLPLLSQTTHLLGGILE